MILAELSRFLLAALFVAAGVLHFVRPRGFEAIVPPRFPNPRLLVYVSGLFEILGGIGLLLPEPLRIWAAWGLIVLLIAVFPANVHHAAARVRIPGLPELPAWLLWLRLPLQFVLLAWVWWAVLA